VSQPPNEPAPKDELARLRSLAETDVAVHRDEIAAAVGPLLARLGERLPAEHTGPVRAQALRTNRLLPEALYKAGLERRLAGDPAGAVELLTAAGDRQEEAASRLADWAERVPSLRVEADAAARLVWTMRWDASKAMRAAGRWEEARDLLTAVRDNVRTDGRHHLVVNDLRLVEARVRQGELAREGHGVRAALQGARPAARKAGRPGFTPEGFVAATGTAPPIKTPFFGIRPPSERGLRPPSDRRRGR
jgi:hypothetical protein